MGHESRHPAGRFTGRASYRDTDPVQPVCVCVSLSLSLTVLLASSQAHEGKALCVDWLTGGAKDAQQGEGEGLNIVSGGSDCVLRSTPIATSSSQ